MRERMVGLLAVSLLSGCVGAGVSRDPFCAAMIRFANAIEPGAEARVSLCVDWGDRCDPDTAASTEPTIVSRSCDHDGNVAASTFCDYLLEHTSAEFPAVNYGDALSCLGHHVYTAEESIAYRWDHGRIRAHGMPGVAAGVDVGIDFVNATEADPSSLRIAVKVASHPFPYEVVEERLGHRAGHEMPIVTGIACAAASTQPIFTDRGFASSYPDGAWVVCDAAVAAGGATATALILHYRYHASRGRALVAQRTEVSLARKHGRWRISAWREAMLDYAP